MQNPYENMMASTIALYLGLLWSGLSFSSAEHKHVESKRLRAEVPAELCKLKGAVYVTDNPKQAHYYVYVEDYDSSADLSVFAEENKLFADKPGLWFFTEQKAFADFIVYFTDSKGMADFSIYYTDVASFAGCK